jgi:hypothetical protein
MARWEPSPQPTGLGLQQVDGSEVEEPDGRKSLVFQTGHGVRFVRITEPSGFTYWLQEIK